jgi:hypothetical protein
MNLQYVLQTLVAKVAPIEVQSCHMSSDAPHSKILEIAGRFSIYGDSQKACGRRDSNPYGLSATSS